MPLIEFMKRFFIAAIAFFAAVCFFPAAGAHGILQPKPYLSPELVASSLATLPAPPQPGTVEFLADEYSYFKAKLLRDTPRGAQAVADADMGPKVLLQFREAFGYEITEESMPATYNLLMRAKECFGTYGCGEAKQHYRRTRPFVYYGTSSLTPWNDEWLKTNYSYPSGHSANFYGLACIMIALNPERQNEIMQRAEEGAYSRVIVGAHWLSDTEAAKIVALCVFARLQADPEYLADFALAKKEIEAKQNASK